MADIEGRLNDRGDARLKEVFGDQLVESNKGDALRRSKSQRIKTHERAHTGNSIGGEKGSGLGFLAQQAALANGMNIGHFKACGPDERRRHGQSGVLQCAPIATEPFLLIAECLWPGDDGNLSMSERKQMLDTKFCRTAVIDTYGVCLQSFRQAVYADNRWTGSDRCRAFR